MKKWIGFHLVLGCFLFIMVSAVSSYAAFALAEGEVTGSRVNVRDTNEIDYDNQLFQVSRGQALEIHGVAGDFYRVSMPGTYNVYVSRDWVQVVRTRGAVTAPGIFVYNLPAEEGGYAIGMLTIGDIVDIESVFESWYSIDFLGETAFVRSDYIDTPSFVDLPAARLPGDSSLADDIIEFGMRYIGVPHVFGGNGPNGFDCSGFITYILRPFGISVQRNSASMANTNGSYVSRSELARGDLVFFAISGGGRISHVGMYIGNGNFLHSSSGRAGVRIDSMHDSFWVRTYVTARRIL